MKSDTKQNSFNGLINKILILFFPVFLVLIAELVATHNIGVFLLFPTVDFRIFVFDLALVSTLFYVLAFLLNYVWAAAALSSLVLYTFGVIEHFKYLSSKSHFVLTDLIMTNNVEDISRFADVHLSFILVFAFLFLILYTAVFFVRQVRLHIRIRVRLCYLLIFFLCWGTMFSYPAAATSVYTAFGISHQNTSDSFVVHDKFRHNGMIAHLAETTTNTVMNCLQPPADYSNKTVYSLLDKSVSSLQQQQQQSNVIVIMNESYADFRTFPQLRVDDSCYTNFDRMASEGIIATCIVPTFGGGTIKTEFELLFGLPMRSLNDNAAPQKMLLDRPQATIPARYRQQGYTTVYLHPFSETFYDRNEIYDQYGFDALYFEEAFTTPDKDCYVQDREVFEKAVSLLQTSERPAYIHITTMQNHMPYGRNHETLTTFESYMNGIAQTDQSIGVLMELLYALDEPTIVLFVGDHFPFFNEERTIYDQVGITGKNSTLVYQQSYVVWSNRGGQALQGFDQAPTMLSSFYLPYYLMRACGLSLDHTAMLFLEESTRTPIYSIAMPDEKNEILDLLTYDMVLGQQYAFVADLV